MHIESILSGERVPCSKSNSDMHIQECEIENIGMHSNYTQQSNSVKVAVIMAEDKIIDFQPYGLDIKDICEVNKEVIASIGLYW